MKRPLSFCAIFLFLFFLTACTPNVPTTVIEPQNIDVTMNCLQVDVEGNVASSKVMAFQLTGLIHNDAALDDPVEIEIHFDESVPFLYPSVEYTDNPVFSEEYFFLGGAYDPKLNQYNRLHVILDKELQYCVVIWGNKFYVGYTGENYDRGAINHIITQYAESSLPATPN